LASTSFAAMCQWPIVAPASLYGASCADAVVADERRGERQGDQQRAFHAAGL